MKVVFQNPQLLSDTWTSGINDYAVEYLRRHRPAVRIWPLHRLRKWFLFLRRKQLPMTGWRYVFFERELRSYDVWLSLSGCSCIQADPPPRHFNGLKLYHVMDFSFWAELAYSQLRACRVDCLLGYARHDQWCDFFQTLYPDYRDRVVPVPFGFGSRFESRKPFAERAHKCSVMGAVNPVRDPLSDPSAIADYAKFYADVQWAHPMRAAVRESLAGLEGIVANFMAIPPATKNLGYNSMTELNNYQLFLNDDSIMHYPPARTYEGTACGAVMLCSDHPCYHDFGWQPGVNCLAHRYADLASFQETALSSLKDQPALAAMQAASVAKARCFTHPSVADGLHQLIEALWRGTPPAELADFWCRWQSQPATAGHNSTG
jgi:hypothetical protein